MSTKGAEYAKAHIAELKAEYEANVLSGHTLAAKYQMSEGTLRKWAKRYAWVRIDADARRAIVNAGLQGEELPSAPAGADPAIGKMLEAAAEDLNDMDLGLKNARLALIRVYNILNEQGANLVPQDLKVISETNRINIDTIRRIRQMDDPDEADRDVKTVMEMVLGRRDGLVNDDAN